MDNSTPDISKIISVIMQNPGLIEEIKNLSGASIEQKNTELPDTAMPTESSGEISESISAPASTVPQQHTQANTKRSNRQKLLTAFKPYVSGERSRAIDSMLSIADIIDAMKAR